ncbi:MAG: exopolyphosphatase [Syntrophorhabdus aromaticivorans]|uniref:Exopolyphosphatase n=1 Tax=Syntrophorhabdus aromaticivorans TaxID=328301 RepID=A0A971M3M6_9BACT|nr:exopolyphosphatase [Syntrophorhabdus aromaticivorans]
MRLLTRSDFDGLICAVLLKHVGMMDEWKFIHPKDVQDGFIQVGKTDILANVPYVPGVGFWFDHHSSEKDRLKFDYTYDGASEPKPSCARVIWDYFGGQDTFPPEFGEMMEYVDRCDSGQLTSDEILQPEGWVLLSFLVDPRTGLGRYKDYRISNYSLMMKIVEWCSTLPVEEILGQPDVRERVKRYFEQDKLFRRQLARCTAVHKNLAVIDLLDETEIYTGNRFLIYSLYPQCNISMHVLWGRDKQNVVFTVGHSILNRTGKTNVGRLMLEYGGGGHERVGTCQVATIRLEKIKKDLIERITADG